MKNNIFKERQSFDDKIVFIFLGAILIGSVIGLFQSLTSASSNLTNIMAYLTVIALSGFLFWWLKRLKIKVSINDKRIKYKLYPIHKKAQRILWEEVEGCEIVKTPPAAQWLGSNIRFSRESWFSLSGRNGLSIEMKDGKRYFIGCKNVDNLMTSFDGFPVAE